MGSRTLHEWNCSVLVTDKHGDIIERLAEANNFLIALAAYEAALQQRTWSRIELRERGRTVKVAETGGYDSETQRVALLRRLA